jgi:hypothetical protein
VRILEQPGELLAFLGAFTAAFMNVHVPANQARTASTASKGGAAVANIPAGSVSR